MPCSTETAGAHDRQIVCLSGVNRPNRADDLVAVTHSPSQIKASRKVRVPSRMNLQGKEPHHHFTVILIVRVWTWPSAPFTA